MSAAADNAVLIQKALQYLAGVCDYAQKPDGVGFNAFDTMFGHELATKDQLTGNQLTAAAKMLRKYSKQLKEAGITLPDSAGVVCNVRLSIGQMDNNIYLAFFGKPSDEIRAWIKTFRGWRWNDTREDKAWSVPWTPDNTNQVNNYFGAALEAPIALSPAKPPEKKPEDTGIGGTLHATPFMQKVKNSNPDVVFSTGKGVILVSFPNWDGRKERVEKIKALPERKRLPNETGSPWAVPDRFAPELVEMFPDAQGIEAIQEAAKVKLALAEKSNQADGAQIEVKGLGGELYPFQAVGIEFLDLAEGRAIIADEPGLGKTVQALGYLQLHPELRPSVIVCPASLKSNWMRELRKWLTVANKAAIVTGTKTYDLEATGAEIVIINYDILSAWVEKIAAWKPAVIIGDEIHYCKNLTSLRTKAMMKLSGKIAKFVGLTGTPVTNRPNELYSLLHMVAPKAWPNHFKYAMRYCNAHNNGFGWDFSGSSNLEELHQQIKPFVIRRKKEQVLKDLPAKRWVNVVVDFDEHMRDEYNRLVAQAEQDVSEMSNAAQLALIERMKQIAVKAKLNGAIEWIRELLETGEKLVVFATHHETVHSLEAAFPECSVTVTGETPMKDRQGMVDRFQNDKAISLFIGNIQAAGVGITLTAASNVAFIEFAWTPGDMVQAADRTHRLGQTESVTVWSLIAENTIDEDITELLETKRQIVDQITDGTVSDDYKFGLLQEIVGRIVSRHEKTA